MITKNEETAPSKDFAIGGPFIVALALFTNINICSVQGGPCFNPSVGLAQVSFDLSQADNSGLRDPLRYYMWIFVVVPFLGGALAAFVMIAYEKVYIRFKDVALSMGEKDVNLMGSFRGQHKVQLTDNGSDHLMVPGEQR